jgi:hypothetical protein
MWCSLTSLIRCHTKKNTETLIDARKKVGRVVQVDRSKYMVLPRHTNSGQRYDVNVAKGFFENVTLR